MYKITFYEKKTVMKTWDEYKDYVKSIDKENKKEMEEIEALAAIISAIIEQRNNLRITQRELAVRCGMAQSSIARIESMKSVPSIETLLKLMHPLGLSLSVTQVN